MQFQKKNQYRRLISDTDKSEIILKKKSNMHSTKIDWTETTIRNV